MQVTHPLRYPHKAMKKMKLAFWRIKTIRVIHHHIPPPQYPNWTIEFNAGTKTSELLEHILTWLDNIWRWRNHKLYIISDISSSHSRSYDILCWYRSTKLCIRDRVLEKIIRHSGRKSVPITYFKRDFKFCDTLVRSSEMVELFYLHWIHTWYTSFT